MREEIATVAFEMRAKGKVTKKIGARGALRDSKERYNPKVMRIRRESICVISRGIGE